MVEFMNSSLARAAPRLEDQAGVVDGTGAGRDRGAAATKVIFDQDLHLRIVRIEYPDIRPATLPCGGRALSGVPR